MIVEKVKSETAPNRGYDAESMEYVDMVQAGIIDPTKVERVALQNAASIASLLLTTEALITDIPEEKPAAAPRDAARRHVLVARGGLRLLPTGGAGHETRSSPCSPRIDCGGTPPLEPVSHCRR